MGKVFFYSLNALVIKPYFVTITNPIIRKCFVFQIYFIFIIRNVCVGKRDYSHPFNPINAL